MNPNAKLRNLFGMKGDKAAIVPEEEEMEDFENGSKMDLSESE